MRNTVFIKINGGVFAKVLQFNLTIVIGLLKFGVYKKTDYKKKQKKKNKGNEFFKFFHLNKLESNIGICSKRSREILQQTEIHNFVTKQKKVFRYKA